MRKQLRLNLTKILLLVAIMVTGVSSWGQTTTIFTHAGGGAAPTNWVFSDNVVVEPVDKGTYWLLEPGTPGDVITTDSYDLSGYSNPVFSVSITSFGVYGSGTAHNALKVEVSYDGGSTYAQSSLTAVTTTSYAARSVNLTQVSSQVKLRLTVNGTNGRGIRLQTLKLVAGPPAASITVTPSTLTDFGSVSVGSTASSSFSLSGSMLTNDVTVTAPSTDFRVSTDNTTWSASVIVPKGTGTLTNVPVYVQFVPQTTGAKSGNISLTSTGVAGKTVAVSGTATGPSAALSGTLNEGSLNGGSFTATLSNATYAATLTASDFTLGNAPAGVSIASVIRISNTVATIILAYDNTDFDTTINNFYINIAGSQLVSGNTMASGNLTITAVQEALVSASYAPGNVCVGAVVSSSFSVTGTNLKPGTITLSAVNGYTYSLTTNGTYTSTLSFSQTGGTLNQTVYVKFEPVALQSYNGSVTISGGGATVNKTLTGAGVNTPATITTPAHNTVIATTANAGGTIASLGCNTITERGIYYSTTNGFADGQGTIVAETAASFTTGAFTVPVSGLLPGTTYYYKAFIFNGTANIYSTQGTFTTTTVPVTVPYTQDFEGAVTEWSFGTGTNKWIIGTGTNNGGTKALYISSNGNTNAYAVNSTQQGTFAELNVDLRGLTAATLAFDWKSQGELYQGSAVDYGEVYINTGGTDVLISGAREFYGSSVFQRRSINLTPYVGGVYTLKFRWVNDNALGTQPPFAVDNVAITANAAPTVVTSAIAGILQNSAKSGGTITSTGNLAIAAKGIVYSTNPNPVIDGPTTLIVNNGTGSEAFESTMTALEDNKMYYVRAFARNASGTGYGNEVTFTTATMPQPVANAATTLSVAGTGFTANWSAVEGAQTYKLDISTSQTFSTPSPVSVTEGFERFSPSISGYSSGEFVLDTGTWVYVNALKATGSGNVYQGVNAIQLQGNAFSGITSPSFGKISTISFYARRVSSATNILVKKIVGGVTTQIQTLELTAAMQLFTVNVNDESSDIKMLFQTSGGALIIDNVTINYTGNIPSYVTGYNDLTVNATSKAVTGLTNGTTYYYRVRAVGTNTTSINSNTITAIAKTPNVWVDGSWSNGTAPTALQDAVILSDYNTGINGTVNALNLTVKTGKFVVASGTSITVGGPIVNNAGAQNFIVENNANIIQNSTAENVGGITVHRNSTPLYRNDYTLWGSPVEGQNMFNFSPITAVARFYNYDALTDLYVAVANVANAVFEPGKGYLIRMPNGGSLPYNAGEVTMTFDGKFVGKPHNGDVIVPLSSLGNKYNAVGNPYPSPITVAGFFDANPGLEGTLYFWRRKNLSGASAYVTVNSDPLDFTSNGQEGADNPNGIIQTGQGFIVQSDNATNVVFNNAMRSASVSNDGSFFRNGGNQSTPPLTEAHRLRLNLTSEAGAFAQMLVSYKSNATMGIDRGIDAKFINDVKTGLNSVIDGVAYAIQGRSLPFSAQDAVPLQFKTDVAGSYTISLDYMDGLFAAGQDIFIKDNVTGAKHNIKDSGYVFAAEAGTYNDRFEVIYTTTVLGTNTPVLDANSVVVYKQGNVININTGSVEMSEVTIYDVRGSVVYTKSGINAAQTAIANLQSQQQVLIVQITTPKGKVSKKIVY